MTTRDHTGPYETIMDHTGPYIRIMIMVNTEYVPTWPLYVLEPKYAFFRVFLKSNLSVKGSVVLRGPCPSIS